MKIEMTKQAIRDLEKLPDHLVEKFDLWLSAIDQMELRKVRIHPGLHDEPLQGQRFGQRSVRLNRSYRVIYKIKKETTSTEAVLIIEITKHRY
jgi:proteic killer suppression protein